MVELAQDDWLAAIEVRHRNGGSVDRTSEWAS
jgi:hypothetical protein